jgi:hypothetical protein
VSLTEMKYLAKVRRYGGGETVIAWCVGREYAEAKADEWNTNYQTDTAYVEPYDPLKNTFNHVINREKIN